MTRYTFETEEQYLEAWQHCMRVAINFTYHRGEYWVESDEFDECDETAFNEIKGVYLPPRPSYI